MAEYEPKRGRLVVVSDVPKPDGGREVHTEFDPNALIMSDDSAKAFLSYDGDPKVKRQLNKLVSDARPDILPPEKLIEPSIVSRVIYWFKNGNS